jgi:hypothetical protein
VLFPTKRIRPLNRNLRNLCNLRIIEIFVESRFLRTLWFTNFSFAMKVPLGHDRGLLE